MFPCGNPQKLQKSVYGDVMSLPVHTAIFTSVWMFFKIVFSSSLMHQNIDLVVKCLISIGKTLQLRGEMLARYCT